MPAIPHSRPCLTQQDKDALAEVLESGMLAEGTVVRQFEEAVSTFMEVRGGVATSSGTSALFLALRACGVGPGDEVVIPTYVCRSVRDAVLWCGATPVLCDVAQDWCMSADTIEPVLSRATRAIVLVHPFGIAAEAKFICELGYPVIEDCCQALGARNEDGMTGSQGALCVLSFHATKLLTTGEGGMVLTNDASLLARLHAMRNGPEGSTRYRLPMCDLQAALGLSQLSQYGAFLERRKWIANRYFAGLADLPVELPASVRKRSIFFRFPIRFRGMDFPGLRAQFAAEGLHVRQGVDCLLHEETASSFPGAEACYRETLSIPIYPALTDEECEQVVRTCQKVLRQARSHRSRVA